MNQPRSIDEILKKYKPLRSRNESPIYYEYQAYGHYLAEVLDDEAHLSLYIKLARDMDRAVLERALSFVRDADARNPARLFMWRLTKLELTS